MKPKAYSYLRMSTDLQLKGDSRRRQLTASQQYADANGLEIAQDDRLEDIGVSAFKGANVKQGTLGRFLEAVNNGTVEKGSYLIVESLDRLSREELLHAHTLFLSIVQSGINLVTLMDQKVYRAETINLVDMITSLVIMERAHEESKTKAIRVGAAWKNKRTKAAQGQPMTARCPGWLRLLSDKTSFQLIPERVEIVRQIFDDCAAGLGMYSIASRLNKAGIPAFEGKNGWHQSSVAKTLNNRAVLGEFQPHVKKDEKRIPDGEPIPRYFPVIIDDELFYQCQHGLSQRKIGRSGSGRKGTGYTNLFSGVARCAYCQDTMAFENKGSGSKGGTYLRCSSARRGRDCAAARWKYADFEASFLAFVEELDLESIVNNDEDAERKKKLESEIAAIRGELSRARDLMEKTFGLLAQGGSIEFVSGKLKELTDSEITLKDRLSKKEAEQAEFEARDSRFYSSREDIKILVTQLQSAASSELYKTRAKIASRLKVLVETLLVAPQGDLPKMKRTVDELAKIVGDESDEVLQYIRNGARQPEQSRRFFAVGFRDAAVRVVYPSYDDPMKFDQQVVAGTMQLFEEAGDADKSSYLDVLKPH